MSTITRMEDWTPHDPLVTENRLLRQDARAMAKELTRLRAIERNARAVMAHHHAGAIDARGALACMALVELGASVYMPVIRRRT